MACVAQRLLPCPESLTSAELVLSMADLVQGVVDQDKGKTPQGSNGSPQVSAQEAASAGGAAKITVLPAHSTAMRPAAAQLSAVTSARKAPSSQPASPSPTAAKENEALRAPSAAKVEEVAASAGFCAHDKVQEAPEGHAVSLKPCASETAAREPMLSPTRVLLKG